MEAPLITVQRKRPRRSQSNSSLCPLRSAVYLTLAATWCSLLLAPGIFTLQAAEHPSHEPTAEPKHSEAIPANPIPSATEAEEHGSVHPAFAKTGSVVASTNVLTPIHKDPKGEQDKEYYMLLELARTQRTQRSVDQAVRNFVALLEGSAPDEIKRSALIEMALLAQENNELAKSQQLFAQYLKRYPEDANMPEILLRQGLLYRQMGAPELALSKFYAVMTGSLKLKFGSLEYYQSLVLQAQTEIAETYYLQGKYADAADFLGRLLKLGGPALNKSQIQFKLVRCFAALNRPVEAAAQAQQFLTAHPKSAEEPEVRFLLAIALKQNGQRQAALEQVFLLLKSQQDRDGASLKNWIYWQQRTGNEIGNQLFQEEDYIHALEVYTALATLSDSPDWQVPAWYQAGLAYERLQQPAKAIEAYDRIVSRKKELDSNPSPSLKTVLDMAKWRTEFINWQIRAQHTGVTNALPTATISASR